MPTLTSSDVGQVITWHPTDALEQSESSKRSRKTPCRSSKHPARHSLAYVRDTPPRSQNHPTVAGLCDAAIG
jgi:hypothetical protein